MTDKSEQDRVLIFDTTLRDGEQSPGATMTHAEKLEIAETARRHGRRHHRGRVSHRLGRRFPRGQARSPRRSKNAVICGLARANLPGYRPLLGGGETRATPAHPHLHRHLAAAPRHSQPDAWTRWPSASTRRSPMRATCATTCSGRRWMPRGPRWDYLCRVVEIAIKAGATTINIPDTVGYTAPRRKRRSDPRLIEERCRVPIR